MARCDTLGCSYPTGECYGTCHKVDTTFVDRHRKALAIKGRVEQRSEHPTEPAPQICRARLALNTFHIYRRADCGFRESARNAWRAVLQRS